MITIYIMMNNGGFYQISSNKHHYSKQVCVMGYNKTETLKQVKKMAREEFKVKKAHFVVY